MGSLNEARPKGKSSVLTVAPGSELTILIKDMNLSFKGTLIGLYPDNYLIVRTAQTKRVINWFDVSRKLIVRYFYDGDVYCFDSSVIHTSRKPENLLFLSYPASVQKDSRRREERVDLLVKASAEIHESQYAVQILDIGFGGCRFVHFFPAAEDRVQDNGKKTDREDLLRIGLGDDVKLSFQMPGKEKLFTCTGVVKNLFQDSERCIAGIEFTSVSQKLIHEIDRYRQGMRSRKEDLSDSD
jgi:hypothetical protein